jgi:hypothetical protein
MLVTDPKQRATMHEVMNHAWMVKGFNGPPDNYLPMREPLTLPLDPAVIQHMTGFKFGPPDVIQAELTRRISSPRYQAAVQRIEKDKEIPTPAPKDVEKRRPFGFDFYRRRNSMTSRETLTNVSTEGLPIGDDPLNAYDPLISIYYLVREDLDRQGKEPQVPAKAAQPPPSPQQPPIVAAPPSPIARPREKHSLAEILPPPQAHTEPHTRRQRARSHSEDQAREPAKNGLLSPDMIPAAKKESTAAGILRRLSTRDRRKEPAAETKSGVVRGSMSMRAKSLGHARRESIQARRAKREADSQHVVKEETDAELGGDKTDNEPETGGGDTSGASNDRFPHRDRDRDEDPDLAKPVYLKGIFSVSTTSTRPLPEIRADIKRVLKQLAVEYAEIKGGFSCRHAPSIATEPAAGRGDPLELSVADGEIRFEIVIVKVPIVSLHGVQFKKVGGDTWQYKAMAEQIVKELRL